MGRPGGNTPNVQGIVAKKRAFVRLILKVLAVTLAFSSLIIFLQPSDLGINVEFDLPGITQLS